MSAGMGVVTEAVMCAVAGAVVDQAASGVDAIERAVTGPVVNPGATEVAGTVMGADAGDVLVPVEAAVVSAVKSAAVGTVASDTVGRRRWRWGGGWISGVPGRLATRDFGWGVASDGAFV